MPLNNASDVNFRYIPDWLLGPDLTEIGVYALEKDLSSGVWNIGGGTKSMAGTIDRIELMEEITHQVIKPVNRRQRNEVIVEDGFALNMVEILKTDQGFLNIIPRMMASGNQFYIYFVRGLEKYEGVFRRGAIRDGVSDEGKNTVEMALRPMDVGLPSNIYVSWLTVVPPFEEF